MGLATHKAFLMAEQHCSWGQMRRGAGLCFTAHKRSWELGKMRLSETDRGVASVGAALAIPILLMLAFGIWTTAQAWNIHNTMEQAAAEAARYGATVIPWEPKTSPAAVRAIADSHLALSGIEASHIDDVCIELIDDGGNSCDGDHTNSTGAEQVYVKIRYPYYKLHFLFFGVSIDMKAGAASGTEESS
jgi:hypothetical protein